MIQSGDVTLTTTRTVSEVIYELDGKIIALSEQLGELRQEVREGFSVFRQQYKDLQNEIRVINERINSVNDRLGSMQYTLSWGVSFVSVLLVAMPLVWGLRKFFSFSIKDAIREAVKAELDAREK